MAIWSVVNSDNVQVVVVLLVLGLSWLEWHLVLFVSMAIIFLW
jgi:hypothetical protein